MRRLHLLRDKREKEGFLNEGDDSNKEKKMTVLFIGNSSSLLHFHFGAGDALQMFKLPLALCVSVHLICVLY